MNRKIFSTIVLVCAIVLSGCGFTESSELMTGARKFIENGEYDKAMSNLSKVLAEDESNTEARGMYYQALKLEKAQKCENRKDYEQEIKELQDLLNDNAGSAKVRSQAEDMLSKAQEYSKNQKRATITRKENAKKSAEENKNNYRSSTVYNYGKYGKRYGTNSEDENSNTLSQKNIQGVSGQGQITTNKHGQGTVNQTYSNQSGISGNSNYNSQGQTSQNYGGSQSDGNTYQGNEHPRQGNGNQ